MNHNTLTIRIIGYVASLIFTLIAFLLITYPNFFPFSSKMAIPFIFTLAILQFITQAVTFLHILNEKGPRWNFVVFLSTLSILFIIIVGSIWIMHHLDYNMMPMAKIRTIF